VTVSAIAAITAATTVTVKYGWPTLQPRLFFARAWEGVGYSFSSSTASAYNDLDKAMLSHYGMNTANGIYTMAYRIVDIATIPVLSIRDAAFPRFCREGASGVERAAELARRLLNRALPLALVTGTAMFIAAPLIPRVVGRGFAESVSALRWLCFIPVFRAVHQLSGSALTGAGLQRYRTGSQLVASMFNLGLNVILIPQHGWLGAAWASLLTDGALAAMNWTVLVCSCRVAGPLPISRRLLTLPRTLEDGD
jgi:O-antigen/teichoic acid export membrane protein